MAFEDGCNFGVPVRPLGHRREQFEFEDNARNAESHRTAQSVFGHLFVVGFYVGLGCVLDGERREGEVNFRKSGSSLFRKMRSGDLKGLHELANDNVVPVIWDAPQEEQPHHKGKGNCILCQQQTAVVAGF